MESIYFPIVCSAMTHPYSGAIVKLRPKNEFISMRFLFIFVTVAILANALVFLLAFLHMSDT